MKILQYTYFITSFLIVVSCKQTKIIYPKISETITENKVPKLNKEKLKHWFHKDVFEDTIPGISTEKLYRKLNHNIVENKNTIIVAVLDSGIDIDHEDLKESIWTNPKEIPDNNIDDDKNGYIDDVNGWNFIGNSKGENINYARKEFLRILVSKGIEKDFASVPKKNLDSITKIARKQYVKEKQQIEDLETKLAAHKTKYLELKNFFKSYFQKDDYSFQEIFKIDTTNNEILKMNVEAFSDILKSQKTESWIKKYEDYIYIVKEFKLNPNYDDRILVGDSINDINDNKYGNSDVKGDLSIESHGTMVAGLIGASRTNEVGIKGVANNVLIMPIRVIPSGDEYDKDVALAIRYAVDNGARIINMSFGKRFSPHMQWVFDAIKYAEKNDVLIVHAAGNVSANIDKEKFYPDDNIEIGKELSENLINVGALNYKLNTKLPAYFSNYGKINVDLFAPGYKIYTTAPNNLYIEESGTSLASPMVAGTAAILMSYFPNLSSKQVKEILMRSGNLYTITVRPPGLKNERVPFSDLSGTGKSINAYNAFLMAEQVSKEKITKKQ